MREGRKGIEDRRKESGEGGMKKEKGKEARGWDRGSEMGRRHEKEG